ncbi:hypothetical protein MMR14E_18955 [Methylobacterium mesophilicum]
MLLNIIRATYSEPLQFTDISTAQGTSSVTGTLAATSSVPTRGGFLTPLPQQFLGLNPTLSSQGANQFNLNNLNTQEFYNGLLAPVTVPQLAAFLRTGYDPVVLLAIAIDEVEIQNGKNRVLLRNDVSDPDQHAGFIFAMDQLVSRGLSAEDSGPDTKVGPPLDAEEAKALLGPILKSTATDAPALRKDDRTGQFQLTRKGGASRLCFDPRRASSKMLKGGPVRYQLVPENPPLTPIPLAFREAVAGPPQAVSDLVVRPRPGDFCGARRDVQLDRSLDVTVRFRPRSIQGMFQYLGTIARMQLGMSDGVPKSLTHHGWGPDDPGYELFKLNLGPTNTGYAVTHRGQTFSIEIDPSGKRNGSSRALQILTDLIALQSSVKNFPAQNLITVVGP